MEDKKSLEDIIDFEYKCGHESSGGIGKYANFFKMSENDFISLISNKSILDLGSGWGDLAKECSLKEIPTKVTSVNPRLALSDFRAKEKKMTEKIVGEEDLAKKVQIVHDERALSAFAQGLPFKDEGFDLVFDVLGPSFYSDDENFREVTQEMYRITKKKGQIMIHADSLNSKTYILKQLGIPFKEIDEDSICITKQ